MKFAEKFLIPGLLSVMFMASAQAGVVVGGTRVIYDGAKKEASLSVSNPDTVPYLIQSWAETQAGGAEKAPFVITPPLYRLEHGQANNMRIVLVGTLPQDKESLFWLNVKSIPSAPKKENTLQVAVKTRIKLIYRPESMKGTIPEQVADKLTWKKMGNQVQVTNPTNFYMNFNKITVAGKTLADVTYVAPGGIARFNLPEASSGGALTFKLINDYGGTGEIHNASL